MKRTRSQYDGNRHFGIGGSRRVQVTCPNRTFGLFTNTVNAPSDLGWIRTDAEQLLTKTHQTNTRHTRSTEGNILYFTINKFDTKCLLLVSASDIEVELSHWTDAQHKHVGVEL